METGWSMGLSELNIDRLLNLANELSQMSDDEIKGTEEYKEIIEIIEKNKMDFVYASGMDKTMTLKRIHQMTLK